MASLPMRAFLLLRRCLYKRIYEPVAYFRYSPRIVTMVRIRSTAMA